ERRPPLDEALVAVGDGRDADRRAVVVHVERRLLEVVRVRAGEIRVLQQLLAKMRAVHEREAPDAADLVAALALFDLARADEAAVPVSEAVEVADPRPDLVRRRVDHRRGVRPCHLPLLSGVAGTLRPHCSRLRKAAARRSAIVCRGVITSGSTTRWSTAGTSASSARSKAAGKSAARSTRSPWPPYARASAAKSGLTSSVALTRPG